MKGILTVLLMACLSALTLPSYADSLKDIVFSELEKQIIQNYYRDQDKNKKGKGGKKRKGADKGLPPGIAKNLQRGKPLPPGIAMTRLPTDLAEKLPPPPEGHKRIYVDGKVLLVDVTTRVIRDKLEEEILDK